MSKRPARRVVNVTAGPLLAAILDLESDEYASKQATKIMESTRALTTLEGHNGDARALLAYFFAGQTNIVRQNRIFADACRRLYESVEFIPDFMIEEFARIMKCEPFAYTAHWNDPIAAALASLGHWDRFAMRFSNAPLETRSTISVEHPYQVPPDAILCPEQIGRTESCSTCGLCWQSERRIAFLQH
jgi:hypothetical protein